MALTLYRKAIVDMVSILKHFHEALPQPSAFPRTYECLRITNKDKRIPSPGKQNVQTLMRSHETNVSMKVTPR